MSSKRKHFADERSELFFSLADNLDWLKELCQERNARFLGMVENVLMDEEDRDDISYRLGWVPNMVQSGDVSWVRRPRFYWLSHQVPDQPFFEIQRNDLGDKIRIIGDLEPEGLWLPEGMVWEAKGAGNRFATFTRPIPRRQPPPDPAGLYHTSEEGRRRWASDNFRYPPYTYEQGNLLTAPDGTLHKMPSYCREVLMGFLRGHTRLLDRELFKKEPFWRAEDVRCAAIGNTFHTTTVALLLGPILCSWNFIPVAPDPNMLHSQLYSEHLEDVYNGPSKSGTSDQASEVSEAGSLGREADLEELLEMEQPQPDLDEVAVHQVLMSRLVHHFLRKVEYRGSDIRVDTSLIFKPGSIPRTSVNPDKWVWKECRAFRWRRSEHINLLELRAAVHAIQWRARRGRFHSFRTMLLIDNQSILAVIAKGRSSSRSVNHLLRKLAALCCTLNIYLLVAWVDTTENPADQASRRFDE